MVNNLNLFYNLDMPVPKQYRHNPLFISLFAESSGIKSFTVTYMTYDGSSVITTETVKNGESGTVTNTTAREQDEQYTYAPDGWATSPNGDKEVDTLTNITENKTVYAAYTKTFRTFTVEFCRANADGGGTLQTLHNVEYGTVLSASSYTGATPTTTKGDATDYPFEGWTPAFAPITKDIIYIAKFGKPMIDISEITDSWDQIIANIDNGTYATKYSIGQYKPLDLGAEGIINMQIVAMDADELTNGGYAPLTFLGMELLNTPRCFHSVDSDSQWSKSNSGSIRYYLLNTIKTLLPANVNSRIQQVNKTYYSQDLVTKTIVDTLWIPSTRELNVSAMETSGIKYDSIYNNDTSRIKYLNNEPKRYWTRTHRSTSTNPIIHVIKVDGKRGQSSPNNNIEYICLGFCLGLESETITDL